MIKKTRILKNEMQVYCYLINNKLCSSKKTTTYCPAFKKAQKMQYTKKKKKNNFKQAVYMSYKYIFSMFYLISGFKCRTFD